MWCECPCWFSCFLLQGIRYSPCLVSLATAGRDAESADQITEAGAPTLAEFEVSLIRYVLNERGFGRVALCLLSI
jgi:hypothetical protein